MKILIAGAGKIGLEIIRQLALESHELVVIDNDEKILEQISNQFDMLTLNGNCASMQILNEANVEHSDLLIAVAGADEINLLTCFTARKLNPDIHTIARVRSPEYLAQLFQMREEFGLSLILNPERSAAKEIFKLLQFPGFLRRESFSNGRAEIVELQVKAGSILENAPMTKLSDILGIKILVCVIVRDGTAFIPGGNDTLHEGDFIYVTGAVAVLSKLLNKLEITSKKARHVTLLGGGRISYYLAESLLAAGVKLKIIERDEARCIELAQHLSDAAIINADGSLQEVLESEGIASTDALVTLTGLDELNVIMSLYGTSREVPQIVTKVNRMESTGLLDNLGIGSVISPRILCAENVLQYARAMQGKTGAAITLCKIADGQAEALEFRVNAKTYYVGVPLKDIKLKRGMLIACIIHNGRTIIPDGSSVYGINDTVIVVTCKQDPIMQFNDIFE
ncbi:MAG: Trk system potassium transporter TrkA [Ruminococcus sp.]|nr:Trk system potassium transporter TrkA [Ruminococcus sp.]